LDQVIPSQGNPWDGASFTLATDLPRGIHSWAGYVSTGLAGPHLFLAPRVVAVPVDAAGTTAHEKRGPARPIYPTGWTTPQPLLPRFSWYRRPAVPMPPRPPWQLRAESPLQLSPKPSPPASPKDTHVALVSSTPTPAPLTSRAVWGAGESSSHWAVRFDS